MGKAKSSLMEEAINKILLLKRAKKNSNALKLDSTQTFGREVRKLKAERDKKVLDLDFRPTFGKGARKNLTEETRKVLRVDFGQTLKREFGDSLEIRTSAGPGSRMIWVVPG